MTKEKEVLSNQAFHQWKQSDCTVALLKLIERAIEISDESIIGHVKGSKDINIELLNAMKGQACSLHEIKISMLDKDCLELYIGEGEDEVE